MMVMAFQSSPIFRLPRARLECSELIFRFMRSVGVCVLLIIMDGSGEKRLASAKRHEGDPQKREQSNYGSISRIENITVTRLRQVSMRSARRHRAGDRDHRDPTAWLSM